MQQNILSGPNRDQQQQQQPALPSYAEAIRTAPPPSSNLHYIHTVNADDTFHPSAPVYGITSESMQNHYTGQTNYNQMIYPSNTIGSTYPVTCTTNAYPQYGQTTDDTGITPTTIHIIRPAPTQPPNCCTGRSGRILSIVLSIIIVGAIFRVTMNSYF